MDFVCSEYAVESPYLVYVYYAQELYSTAEAELARSHLVAKTASLWDAAIGVAAGRARRGDPSVPMVALATAHPAKFADAVERATGHRPGSHLTFSCC